MDRRYTVMTYLLFALSGCAHAMHSIDRCEEVRERNLALQTSLSRKLAGVTLINVDSAVWNREVHYLNDLFSSVDAVVQTAQHSCNSADRRHRSARVELGETVESTLDAAEVLLENFPDTVDSHFGFSTHVTFGRVLFRDSQDQQHGVTATLTIVKPEGTLRITTGPSTVSAGAMQMSTPTLGWEQKNSQQFGRESQNMRLSGQHVAIPFDWSVEAPLQLSQYVRNVWEVENNISATVKAQSVSDVTGYLVWNSYEAGISTALLLLERISDGRRFWTKTAAGGLFSFHNLPAGRYRIQVYGPDRDLPNPYGTVRAWQLRHCTERQIQSSGQIAPIRIPARDNSC